ncbi:major facilitator superfamily domain-containing protein [Aspergillus undulatus]|uniref:major facilitator superfamily domain-containing protein n=1 Tax=Aspergillus undulatus TaxID=1810928 RepID=UPI003CCD392E
MEAPSPELAGRRGEDLRHDSLRSLSDDEYKRLGRKAALKIDIVVFPPLMLMYILNYLDRNNTTAAKLANIQEDLGLSETEFQSCISILYAGYIIMQIPSNMIPGKLKWPAVYICAAMGIWGVISAAQAAVTNFAGLMVARFMVGFVEAVFFPGALYYLSMFYNRNQYAFRAALFYSGSQLGNAIGGLFAIGILKLDGAHGLAGWRWLFLVVGVLTVGLAFIFTLILPNSLDGVPRMTQLERDWITWNYQKDQGQQDDRNEISATQGLMLALQDPKTWLLLATLYAVFISAGVTNLFQPVVATLGYSRTITYALSAPPFILCCFAMMVVGWNSDRVGEHYYHIVLPLGLTIVANVMAVVTLNTEARYTAMMLMPASFYSATTVIYSWMSGSLSQPAPKRAAAIAIIISVCNTTNVWTPYLYNGAPRYLTAFSVNLAAAVAAILMATLNLIYLVRQNRKLDRGEPTGRSGPTAAQQASGFRYLNYQTSVDESEDLDSK